NAYDTAKVDKSLERKVVQSVRHPNYPQGLPINFDIMISKLESPVMDVQPIKMNFDETFPSKSGDGLKIMGFGSTIPGPDAPLQPSQVLQVAPTNYVSFQECAVAEDPETGNDYGNSAKDTLVEDWWLCTIFNDPVVTGTCFGDSGGPVFRQGKNMGTDLLVGVISGASGYCGNPNLPLWNNRVSYFQDWFTSVGCEMSDSPPDYWGCSGGSRGGGGGGGGEGGSSLGIIIAAVVVVALVAAVTLYAWKRRKQSVTKEKEAKANKYDEERPQPPARPSKTQPPSPASSDASTERKTPIIRRPSGIFAKKQSMESIDSAKEDASSEAKPSIARRPSGLNIGRQSTDPKEARTSPLARRPSGLFNKGPFTDSKDTKVEPSKSPPARRPSGLFNKRSSTESDEVPKSPLARRPSGLFNKRPSMEPKEENKPPSLNGRKTLMNAADSKEDKKEKEKFDPLDSLPGWLTKKPSFLKMGEKKESSDDDFVPKDIADLVDQIDKELDNVVSHDKGTTDRGRSRSKDPPSPSRRTEDLVIDETIETRWKHEEDQPIPSHAAVGDQSLLTEKAQATLEIDEDELRREMNQRVEEAVAHWNDRNPTNMGTDVHHLATTNKSLETEMILLDQNQSHSVRWRQGVLVPTPPRTRSDVAPSSSSRSSTRDNTTRTPVSRTKSDSVATPSKPSSFSQRPGSRGWSSPTANPPSSRQTSEAPSSRGWSSPTAKPSPSRHISQERGRNKSSSPAKGSLSRTNSVDARSSRNAADPPMSPRRSLPRSNSDNALRRSSGGDSGGYKSVFDQWKQREENAKPTVAKNSDGTVTVSRARRNADGVKVVTKTNYASVDLARRHGVEV
ncbi:MAG: hypothetical protein SGILL_002817, partial [Bacillariaceae sp.]